MNNKEEFVSWFRQATGNEPYPFQIRFACEPVMPELVDVPTGLGKTAIMPGYVSARMSHFRKLND